MLVLLSVVASLRAGPPAITARSESQAIDDVTAVLPVRGDPQLLEGVSRSLARGRDRTFVVGVPEDKCVLGCQEIAPVSRSMVFGQVERWLLLSS
jgi:hypothetical protein